MKKWLTIAAFLLASSQTQAIPACDGIDLQELKEQLLKDVHNEHDYKALKSYKWKICIRTLGTTLYKMEKDKADKIKEEQAEAAQGGEEGEKNEDVNANNNDKPDNSKKEESTEDKDTPSENKDTNQNQEEGNKPEENKLSAIETDIANHYLHQIYPRYPLL